MNWLYIVGIFTVGCPALGALVLDASKLSSGAKIEQVDPTTPYDKWATLCAHNSYSSEAYGYWPYAQQSLSVTDQIKMGAYTLMPDTYSVDTGNILKKKRDICLCHQSCDLTALFRAAKNPLSTVKNIITLSTPQGQTLKEYLSEVVTCLRQDPTLVLTFIFEDYVKDPAFFDQVLEESGITQYILRPTDWNPDKQGGWPTLGWMRQNNKRVVMFIDVRSYEGVSKYLRYQWYYMAENAFSTIEIDPAQAKGQSIASDERGSSSGAGAYCTRYLYLFNFFSDFPIPYQDITDVKKFLAEFKRRNDYATLNGTGLVDALNTCVARGLGANTVYSGRWPNMIALDYIEQGLGVAIVNYLNQQWAQTHDEKMFAPIRPYNQVPPVYAAS